GTLLLAGLMSAAMTEAVGTNSCANSNSFDANSTPIVVAPVTLPAGRLMLATRPICTGSLAVVKTMGVVVIAAFTASTPGVLATNTATRRSTSSSAITGTRSYCHRPAVLDRHVLGLDIAGLLQALTECSHHRHVAARRCAVEEPDPRHRRLLRPRRDRPRRSAAKQRDELAPFPLMEMHPLPLARVAA